MPYPALAGLRSVVALAIAVSRVRMICHSTLHIAVALAANRDSALAAGLRSALVACTGMIDKS